MTRRRVIIAGGTLAALMLIAIALAPAVTAGYCADAPLSDASFCDSTSTSLVGLTTNFWAWVIASAVAVGVGIWVALRSSEKD